MGPMIFNGRGRRAIWGPDAVSAHTVALVTIIGIVAMKSQGAVSFGTIPGRRTRNQPKAQKTIITIIVTQINGSISCDSTSVLAGTRMSVCSMLSHHDGIIIDRIGFQELPGVSDLRMCFTIRVGDC